MPQLKPITSSENYIAGNKQQYTIKKQFKPETSALVLIDYQAGTLQLIKTMQSDQPLRNAVTLAKAANAYKIPAVLTSSEEDQIQGSIAPSLQRVLPDAYQNRRR